MGISIWQLLIILLIVVLLFGTKKLAGMGKEQVEHREAERIIEGKVESKEKDQV